MRVNVDLPGLFELSALDCLRDRVAGCHEPNTQHVHRYFSERVVSHLDEPLRVRGGVGAVGFGSSDEIPGTGGEDALCVRTVSRRRLRVANVSEDLGPNWRWVLDQPPLADRVDVTSASTSWTGRTLAMLPARKSVTRSLTAARLAIASRIRPFDLVISHGPLVTAWTELMLRLAGARTRHVAYSFNFTDLPTGSRRVLLTRAFAGVDRFVVFTRAEQSLYARYFGIPREKIVRAPWGVRRPLTEPLPRIIEGRYFAALGGEARDYATLCEAARLRPEVPFVVVARPWNFSGVRVPPNVRTFFNLPFAEAWSLVAHAEAAIVPLRSRETPCGLVTLVGGMHLGKAQIVTRAAGVSDYITHDYNALMVPPRDPCAIANALDRLRHEPELAMRLGHNAREQAEKRCSERRTIDFAVGLLDELDELDELRGAPQDDVATQADDALAFERTIQAPEAIMRVSTAASVSPS